MTADGLPVEEPVVDPATTPYWEGAAGGRLVLPRCNTCDWVIWYPRELCTACGSTDVTWVEASGRGQVYTFSVIRRAPGAWSDAAPYTLAYVELDEGPRVLTNIVGIDPDEVEIGQRVEVVFAATSTGAVVPRFRPLVEGTVDEPGAR